MTPDQTIFIAVADGVWLAIIAAVVTIMGGFTSVMLAWIKLSADRIAAEAKEQRTSNAKVQKEASDHAATEAAKAAIVGEKVHDLVNSSMGIQLRKHADAQRQIAKDSPTPENLAAAAAAEEDYQEHQRRQALVDSKHPIKGSGD